MIDKSIVRSAVDEWITDTDYFLVDINVDEQNRIIVEIDHKDGVWIDDCCELSRHIESKLDRDVEDYELEVGSAGLGQPFKIVKQYEINVGRSVELLTSSGKKQTGILSSANDEGFTVVCKEKVKKEGDKRPKMTDVEYHYGYDDVKWVKASIDFK